MNLVTNYLYLADRFTDYFLKRTTRVCTNMYEKTLTDSLKYANICDECTVVYEKTRYLHEGRLN